MWRPIILIVGIIVLLSNKKKVFGAEPYDRIGSYTDEELYSNFNVRQLEVAYIESVSLDNRNAQRRLKRAIAYKKGE